MKKLLIALLVIVLIVVGIGFIPITETEQLPYSCVRTETYTYNYSTWGSTAWDSFDLFIGCVAKEQVNVRNTEALGGTLSVNFYCYYGDQWMTVADTRYIPPNQYVTFNGTFDIGCGEPWTWKEPTVIAPIETRQIEAVCYESYTHTKRLLWR